MSYIFYLLFQMRWTAVLVQQCVLLVTYLLITLEAVPIDIDKTKVKGEPHVEGEKIENPVSKLILVNEDHVLWF